MSAPSTERVQRLHAKRRLLGLCRRCGQPVDGPTAHCSACRAIGNAESRAGRLRHKTQAQHEGTCAKCRRPHVGLTILCKTHYLQNRTHFALCSTSFAPAIKQKLVAQESGCYYTGTTLVLGVNDSLDYVLSIAKHPELRADIANVVWCTREINTMKNGMDADEFLTMCRLICNRWPS